MPPLSRWVIRVALVQFGVGVVLGAWILIARGTPSLPLPPWIRPAHLELALLGWTLQFAMGVAFWILPRHARAPDRGPPPTAIGAFILFNLGILLAVAGAVTGSAALVLAGRIAEATGVLLFAANAWPRIKAFGT